MFVSQTYQQMYAKMVDIFLICQKHESVRWQYIFTM